jgi:hypothetical protein
LLAVLESNPRNLHIFELYRTKLVEKFKISLDFSRVESLSRSLLHVEFFPSCNCLIAFNSTSEYFILAFNNSKKKTKNKVKFSLKLVQNENHFFENKICKVFDLGNFQLGIIFGDQYSGYNLKFFRITRDMGGQLGLQIDFERRCLLDLNTKLSGVKFQEKLLDLQVLPEKWIVFLFERGLKLFSLNKQR